MQMVYSEPTPDIAQHFEASTIEVSRYAHALARGLRTRSRSVEQCLRALSYDATAIANLAAALVTAIRSGHKVLAAGNGGSAAEAQHLVAELVGRFQHDRNPYPAISLTTDTSILTAVANDYGYEEVFARQIRALGQPGDVLIALSTSGESINLLRAVEVANALGISTFALTGNHEGSLCRLASCSIRVPTSTSPEVQEIHSILVHLVCGVVETELATRDGVD